MDVLQGELDAVEALFLLPPLDIHLKLSTYYFAMLSSSNPGRLKRKSASKQNSIHTENGPPDQNAMFQIVTSCTCVY